MAARTRNARDPSKNGRARRPSGDPLRAPELYLNRELSWLEFNRRVLEESLDERNPLLERVKFLAIFSSNLDEFFMVRVAGLQSELLAGDAEVGRDGLSPSEQLAAIKLTVSDLSSRQRRCWLEDILPRLRAEGVCLEQYDSLGPKDRRWLKHYFERQVFPVLTPLAVDSGHPFPHISNLSLNMLIVIEDKRGEHFARMKIPPVVPRFVEIPERESPRAATTGSKRRFVLLEDVIEANVDQLFPGKHVKSTHMFRITRDADIEFREGTSDSLLKLIEAELEQRLFGFAVRLTVEPTMPASIRSWLANKLNVSSDDIYQLPRPHGLADLMELYAIDRPDLKDPPIVPRYPSELRVAGSVFAALDRQDILLYHPYDSFAAVVDFIRQAAADEHVVAIKQTLYRVGSHSPIVDALLEARDDETQIAVLVELRARFDEESNINWARALEKEGVHVAYGLTGLKTHCKIAMAVRRDGTRLRRYVHLGTGNYNAATARVYTDIGLMTTDEDIAADVSDVFNYLTGYSAQTRFRKLLVAPVNMRSGLTDLIRRETDQGSNGRIIMKMNSLSDYKMIEELYRAAQAGVKIDLIVRGICCLRPGIPSVSERIRVLSVVGRFLEHARLYYFAHGARDGGEIVYSGSADLMRRNLDFRVEVLFPVEDPRLLEHVRDNILGLQLRDNVRARELQRDGSYTRLGAIDDQPTIDSQAIFTREDLAAANSGILMSLRDPS
ncbi:MAG TPA: polyphosphate kinase 1 [Thermomicrobiales bacterium]|nr:polyphosphate kinase 1 [Thermomicrobiales bacterium]